MLKPEQERPVPDLSQASFRGRELTFGSRSEAACAILLERYTDWRAVLGVTCQVPAGPKRIDFYLPEHDTFLEYHPIKRWDWKSSEASKLYGEHFRRLSLNQQRASWSAIKQEFAHRYYLDRRLVLDLTGHKEFPLICVQSGEDFYRQVLRGLYSCEISEREFLKEWASVINSL